MTLPGNWQAGQDFGASDENLVQATINALGAGTLPIPLSVSTSTAASLTLTTSHNAYVFKGALVATWTLPAVSGNDGAVLELYNRGTAPVTLQCAGSDELYERGSTSTTRTFNVGAGLSLVNDGTYWIVLES